MTPPMPTDTPSAGAEKKAAQVVRECDHTYHELPDEACLECIALALDAFAREQILAERQVDWEKVCREREAAVWGEAADTLEKVAADLDGLYIDEADEFLRGYKIAQQSLTSALFVHAALFRTRAAEARRKG